MGDKEEDENLLQPAFLFVCPLYTSFSRRRGEGRNICPNF